MAPAAAGANRGRPGGVFGERVYKAGRLWCNRPVRPECDEITRSAEPPRPLARPRRARARDPGPALDARLRAEAMHSAADPAEGDRIARRRIAEERIRQRAHRGQNPASTPFP